MLVVNLFGGPGSGKSTMAARVFSELKEQGYNCELVTEYAKDLTWQESFKVLGNQFYISAKQHHRLWRLSEGVDIVITDSPLIQGIIYSKLGATFDKLIFEEARKFDNMNIFLKRVKKYNPKGRGQTLEEAKKLDFEIHNLPIHFDLEIEGEKESTDTIVKLIKKKHDSNQE